MLMSDRVLCKRETRNHDNVAVGGVLVLVYIVIYICLLNFYSIYIYTRKELIEQQLSTKRQEEK